MTTAQRERAGRLWAISCLTALLIIAPDHIQSGLDHVSLGMMLAAAKDGNSGSGSGSSSGSGSGGDSGSNSGSSGGSGDSGSGSGNSGPGGSGDDGGSDGSGDRKGSDDQSGRGHHIGPSGENIEVRGNRIQVIYPNGWKEELKDGLFEMRDPVGRIVVKRSATLKDRARMRLLLR